MAGNTTLDTATTAIGGLMATYYDRLLLERLTPQLKYDQFAVKKDLPRNSGKVIVWNKLTNLASGKVLTELDVPGLSAYSATKVSATLVQYGDVYGVSDFFDMTALSQPLKDLVGLASDAAALTVDQYYAEEIGFQSACSTGWVGQTGSASSVSYLSCFTAGFPLQINHLVTWSKVGIENNTYNPTISAMGVDRIRKAVAHLRNMNAKPQSDGYYVGIIHPLIAEYLMGDSDWASWNQYTNAEAMYKGEIGRVHSVRFVSSTNAIKKTMYASTWSAGASNFSAGGQMYGTLIVGQGAYGGVHMNGNAGKVSVVDFKPDKADPIGQFGTVGFSVTMAAKILNASAGIIMVDYISD